MPTVRFTACSISRMKIKICSKCKKKKRISDGYSKDVSKPDGVYSSCKVCVRNSNGSNKRVPRTKINRKGEILRRCSTCKQYKELRKFYTNSFKRDGIHDHCKSCSIKNAKSENAKNGQKNRKQVERLIALKAYGGDPPKCKCCGETENKFLALDHINGGGREHRKGKFHFYRWLALNGFPKGLQVLCHNCNMAKGFYGRCPHEYAFQVNE